MSEKKTPKEMLEYRIKLFRDAQAFRKPDRTPVCANVTSWMFNDAGYTAGQACRDYSIIEQCMERFVKLYPCDMFNYTMSGFRNVFLLADAMGGSIYSEGEDGDNLNIVAEEYITPEEYDDLFENYQKALWEKVMPRMFPGVKDFTPEQMAKAAQTEWEYQRETTRINQKMRDELGIPVEMNINHIVQPLENLFGNHRGIKGLSMDLRRRPEQVLKFIEICGKGGRDYFAKKVREFDGPDMNEAYDCMTGILAHTIMNRRQFDRFKAPYLEESLRLAEQYHKTVVFYSEGDWARFGDFFNQFRRGTLNMTVEQDDPFEIRKKFPNICISGGLDVGVLRSGTEQQCIDMAKRAIDELGWEGGLILSPNKMLAYPNDTSSNNLRAVFEFAAEYH